MVTLPEMPRYRDLCPTCNRSRLSCFCKYAKPFETNTHFLILMHPREFKRQRTGTGRLTRLSLVNSQIIVGTDFDGHAELNAILADRAFFPLLLFPGGNTFDLSSAEFSDVMPRRRPLVIVIDATWSSARKMLHRSRNLQGLPRITFIHDGASKFVIKRQPNRYALSTIEAVYRVLDTMNQHRHEVLEGRHHSLMQTLEAVVKFQLECAANPDLPSHRIRK